MTRDDEDLLFLEGTCHPNKSALQFYVSATTATESSFPFDAEDTYRGMTVPGTDAVILWPKEHVPEFPVEVDDCPDELVPWPVEENQPSTSTSTQHSHSHE